MADTRPWIKLWKSVLTDPDLQRLSLADLGRWLQLLVFVGTHGDGGRIMIPHLSDLSDLFADWVETPLGELDEDHERTTGGPLRDRLRTKSRPRSRDIQRVLNRLPGVRWERASEDGVGYVVWFPKWSKYQVDNSATRVHAFRERQRERNGQPPLPRHGDDPLQNKACNGAREEKTRQEPPYPRGIDDMHGHFNLRD
jgi:hypothetical protein